MPGEGRGLSSRQTHQAVRDREIGHLTTLKSVQKLQVALHAKAKAEAGYRFHALYDKRPLNDFWARAPIPSRHTGGLKASADRKSPGFPVVVC